MCALHQSCAETSYGTVSHPDSTIVGYPLQRQAATVHKVSIDRAKDFPRAAAFRRKTNKGDGKSTSTCCATNSRGYRTRRNGPTKSLGKTPKTRQCTRVNRLYPNARLGFTMQAVARCFTGGCACSHPMRATPTPKTGRWGTPFLLREGISRDQQSAPQSYKTRPVEWEHASHGGIDFALASTHGVSCASRPGWTQIETSAQCEEAASAFELPSRKEPYSMQFQGKTWYLVRRAVGDHWHNATDDLAGTDNYGQYKWDPLSDSGFSTSFGERYTQLLVATGDLKNWVILNRSSGVSQRMPMCSWMAGNAFPPLLQHWHPPTNLHHSYSHHFSHWHPHHWHPYGHPHYQHSYWHPHGTLGTNPTQHGWAMW